MDLPLHEQLKQRYIEILHKPEHQALLQACTEEESKLSNIHLGFVPEGYTLATPNKILIVGRETRGWFRNEINTYNPDAVEKLMRNSRNHFTGKLPPSKRKKGFTFFNFVHKVASRSGNGGLLWANIFAVDYSKGHPARAGNERFKQIKCLSRELLHAQIDILKPDIILFVSGGQGVHARREYFPDLTPSGMDTDGIEKRFLERFYFPAPLAHIECYRSSHPSARAKKNQEALKKLVSLLPCKEKKPA